MAIVTRASKVIRVCFDFTSLSDWLKKLAPLSQPIRSETKTNRDSLLRVLIGSLDCVCPNVIGQFWFYTESKIAQTAWI